MRFRAGCWRGWCRHRRCCPHAPTRPFPQPTATPLSFSFSFLRLGNCSEWLGGTVEGGGRRAGGLPVEGLADGAHRRHHRRRRVVPPVPTHHHIHRHHVTIARAKRRSRTAEPGWPQQKGVRHVHGVDSVVACEERDARVSSVGPLRRRVRQRLREDLHPTQNHSSEEDQEVRLFRGGERTIAEPAGQAYVFQNLAPFSLRDGGRMNADL